MRPPRPRRVAQRSSQGPVRRHPTTFVMAGLVPAIHVLRCAKSVDARHKAGHDEGKDHENLAFGWIFAPAAHSPASIFLPSGGCTRVILKRPSAQTTVTPSASTATISPSLPAMPFGSFAGSGLASKILTVLPSSVDQAPGAGLQPRISRSICSQGLPQSILALSALHMPS